MDEKTDRPHNPIETLYLAFCNAWLAGERPDPEAFCKKVPEDSSELREKIENFLFVEQGLSDGGTAESGYEAEGKSKISVTSGVTLGDFKILKEIGRGGMATVYEDEQLSLNRKVALKILPAHLTLSDQSIKKFYREAEAGGRQRHSGIVSVYAVGEHEGRHFIAQELIEGGRTLADRLDELRAEDELPIRYFRFVAKLISSLASALEHAHTRGVIHRDIKPSNILLTREEDPKVSDFGLAKVENALSLSRSGEFAGTPYYMSPEQAMSRRMGIDRRTDVYSLGVTLYEMLTLQRPFDGNTSHEVLKKIMLIDPEIPHRANTLVPRDLSTICLKAMEKDPELRYQSMMEFRDDLKRFLAGDLILAKPTGAVTRYYKRLKRRPALCVSIGSALLITAVVLVSLIYNHYSIQDKERSFLKDSFNRLMAIADPAQSGPVDKVVEELHRLTEEMQTEFDRPSIEAADLQNKIGKIYFSLGHYKKAEPLLLKAMEFKRELLGPNHLDTLESMTEVARLHKRKGNFTQAESVYREILDTCRFYSEYGKEHPFTLATISRQAGVLNELGKSQEAEDLFIEVIEEQRRLFGEESLDLFESMAGLAKVRFDLGKYDEAFTLCREVLDNRLRILGESHPKTLDAMSDLAVMFGNAGEYSEAERLHNETITIKRIKLGDRHLDLLASKTNLAELYQTQDRIDEAITVYQEIIEMSEGHKDIDKENPLILTVKHNMASCFISQSDLEGAKQLYKEVVDSRNRILGKDHRDTLSSIHMLGNVFERLEEYSQATKCYQTAYAGYCRILGREHPYTLASMGGVAYMLYCVGKKEESEVMYRNALESCRRVLGEDHEYTAFYNDIIPKLFESGSDY